MTLSLRLFVASFALALASGNAAAGGRHSGTHHHHGTSTGQPGVAAKVSRTVHVDMDDRMRFTPSTINVERGETIRFIVTNQGRMKHEMVLGSLPELKQHAIHMVRFPDMKHADPNQISVEPGASGELIWHFTHAGRFDFACLIPGHFEAGMVGTIEIAESAGRSKQKGKP